MVITHGNKTANKRKILALFSALVMSLGAIIEGHPEAAGAFLHTWQLKPYENQAAFCAAA